jgi:putative membrane protein
VPGSRPLRVLTEPSVAALLDLGGLWLLYTTPLFALAQHQPVVHLLVHVHLVLAGYLLSAVLVGPDPLPHRRSPLHRALVLVAVMAAHGILAKHLYAQPPAGVGAGAETGAMVMYYGGDLVELVLVVLLCRRWFSVQQPRAAGFGAG